MAKYDIPLMRPWLPEETEAAVLGVLKSGYLTEGPVTREFERAVADFLGIEHVLAVTSCTTGLEMALRCLEIGPGDEVIAPDYTYPATASVVAMVGATTVLVDVDPDTFLIDYDALEAAITPRTKAVIPVSQFGNPLDYSRLAQLQDRYGFRLIEDAACALGAEYEGLPVGNHADIAVFSCHPRKFITTGEGGLVVTANGEWAEWMNSFKHFGMDCGETRSTTAFPMIGTNLKMSNLLSAVGLSQMKHVTEMLERRRELADRYCSLLAGVPEVKCPVTTPGGIHSWQTFAVQVDDRDRVMAAMRNSGIEVQIGTYTLHHHDAFCSSSRCRWSGDLTASSYAFDHALALPLYHELSGSEQERTVNTLVDVMEAGR